MAQINPKLGDVAANMALYEAGIREAAGRDVDLVVFPELSLTGYFLRDMVPDVAVRLASPEMERLKVLSREVSLGGRPRAGERGSPVLQRRGVFRGR